MKWNRRSNWYNDPIKIQRHCSCWSLDSPVHLVRPLVGLFINSMSYLIIWLETTKQCNMHYVSTGACCMLHWPAIRYWIIHSCHIHHQSCQLHFQNSMNIDDLDFSVKVLLSVVNCCWLMILLDSGKNCCSQMRCCRNDHSIDPPRYFLYLA